MGLYIKAGKGGVGKTTSAVALALFLSQKRKSRTAVIDYDGGHSVMDTLGLKSKPEVNTIEQIRPNLSLAVIDNVDFVSITDFQEQRRTFEEYFEQFPSDNGILPLCDMINAFFGVPTDTPTTQKFAVLVSILLKLEEDGFENVIIDVEPTAGFKQLISAAARTARSIRNLAKTGIVKLAILNAAWPDIRKYLGSSYINKANFYTARIEKAVTMIKDAIFSLVCIPELSPVRQTFEVRKIIENFGGKVSAQIVNNIRGDKHESEAIAVLDNNLPIIKIQNDSSIHDENYREKLLLQIGEMIATGLQI